MPRLDQDIFDRYMARVASDYSQYSSGKIDKTQRDQLDYDAEQAAMNEQMYRDIGDFFSTLGDFDWPCFYSLMARERIS